MPLNVLVKQCYCVVFLNFRMSFAWRAVFEVAVSTHTLMHLGLRACAGLSRLLVSVTKQLCSVSSFLAGFL